MPPSDPGPPVVVTQLDFDIIREMYPRGGVEISGVDPRLNANRIAARLGIGRARVSARFRRWRELGFVARYEVWPNPQLFGLNGVSFDVRVRDRAEKPEVVERIALVPGAIGGIDVLGDWLAATFVLPVGEDPGRLVALVRNLSGVAEVGPPVVWGTPPGGTRPLSPLEQRIVRALRKFPAESLTGIARHVGVPTRTMTARYARLLDERAVWFLPIFDFRALSGPVLDLYVEFTDATERPAFGRALRQYHPGSIEFVRAPFGPLLPERIGSYFVVPRSAAEVDDIERWVRRQPGVCGVESSTLVRVLSFPETFDRLLATGPAAAPAPARARRRLPAPARPPGGRARSPRIK